MAIELVYGSNTLPINITQQLINYAENELNVPPSYLITKLHYEGLWGGSAIARSNNNWGGMTWSSSWDSPHTRASGVIVTRGSPRPANEGGYYIRYASVNDFLIDWSHLIRRGGIYNVADSETFQEAVKGMFIVGGADYDYATMNVEGSQQRYELYLAGMEARRTAINTANNGALDTLDSESHGTDDPDPDPNPEPPEPFPDDPDDTAGGIDVARFINELNTLIENMLTKDVHKSGNSEHYQNGFLTLLNQLSNSYKVKPNSHFFNEIKKKFEEFNSEYIPEPDDPDPDDPDPEPEPEPNEKRFPVRIENGINFWKRSNWGVGTLQRNMTYGQRSTGQFHYGYDIGGGGRRHTIYSVTNGEVIQANYANGIGYRLTIENSEDPYYLQYGHLDSFLVDVGDTVVAGDPIAIMGDTGGNYAIHLDLKISTTPNGFYALDTTIDPEKYLEVNGDNSTQLQQP